MKGVVFFVMLFFSAVRVNAQEQEIEQLLLDVEKLAQFKQILSDMKDGYEILVKGYSTIKDISQGSFDLHQAFLDGLLQVSPTVKQYKRIGEIIVRQIRVVKDCRLAIKRFTIGDVLDARESKYLKSTYERVMKESIQRLDDLTKVITAGTMRMSDDERLTAIDRIYDQQQEQQNFVRSFSNANNILLLQRAKAMQEARVIQQLVK